MGALRGLLDLTGQMALVDRGSRGLGLQAAEGLDEFGATMTWDGGAL
jgi:hypothetical protein